MQKPQFEAFAKSGFASNVDAVCVGSGRFLRAVLVPLLRRIGSQVIVAQTRGQDFVDYCVANNGEYEVDTVLRDGSIETEKFQLAAVGSLGNELGKKAFMKLPSQLPTLKYIGVGVTEGGITVDGQSMRDLAEFLHHCFLAIPDNVLSIINTDNVPANGDAIKRCVAECSWPGKPTDAAFTKYLNTKVHFHNTMVDRIVAHRAGNSLVPLAEPLPAKALVIEDLGRVLDSAKVASSPGSLIRYNRGEIEQDHLLKLCIANGIHTSMVYTMALSRLKNTTQCIDLAVVLRYIELLFEQDILPGLIKRGVDAQKAKEVYLEWMQRLQHPYFGMDTFFVSQNAMSKYEIRVFSSIANNLTSGEKDYRPSACMAFAAAVLLRFLTPVEAIFTSTSRGNVFVGQMDDIADWTPRVSNSGVSERKYTYVSGLTTNVSTGKYEFRDGLQGDIPQLLFSCRSAFLKDGQDNGASLGVHIAKALSSTVKGFDLSNPILLDFAGEVASLYQRLIRGDRSSLQVLEEIVRNVDSSEYLESAEAVETFVRHTVNETKVVDVHTHLFPPSHGKLMLWGINELLTYHYLVAEYLMTAPMEVEEFNSYPKAKQAELIWQHLFIDRTPLSEACRGVITTLQALGLGELVAKRDLKGLQKWFEEQDVHEYVDTVFRLAGIDYAVMTNIPFEPEEAKHWLPDPATSAPPPEWSRKHFRSALRVDQILLGDWDSINPSLKRFALPETLDGVKELLVRWIDIMKPEYFMSSVPIDFVYPGDHSGGQSQRPDGADLLLKVLLPLAEAKQLPIALKFDSVRPINARLGVAGDGVKASDVQTLQKLCRSFPNVKFLATFLSRVNQHEVTVTANKFRNLHLYGCWWYCNNPSIVEEMTRMRIEILGTAFTSQHSDARVLDQLVYKWKHSRDTIGTVLVNMYQKLARSGWKISKKDVQRDVARLFGKSYEEFMAK